MDEPVGQRFSQVYLRRSDLLKDSKRMRRRLAALYTQYEHLALLGVTMESELGIEVGGRAQYASFWPTFLDSIDVRDILDSITLRYLTIVDYQSRPDQRTRGAYLASVRRILSEEQVGYRVDDEAGVHFLVDVEFERVRQSAIAGLGEARYTGVRASFDAAFTALDGTPPDGKLALRSAFFAVEGLFRLMFPTAPQLSAAELQRHLKPRLDDVFAGQKPAIHVAHKQLAALSDWVDAAHFYRHEPGTEEPAQPPLELAIYQVTQAGAHIRWLIGLDPLR